MSAGEGHVFHNRLTHSIQVAQVGRRIAEKLIADHKGSPITEIDPDVVEAACLAHDLGHPPFGHVAEQELDILATSSCLPDGFEGNAQSFRIVTKLASASSLGPGLNLTRATLNGLLKYPWLRGENQEKKDKWGAYETEREYFNWAREGYYATADERRFEKSPEAELMDLADDITYSVHDVDDFYRAGLMPIDRLRIDPREQERFFEDVFEREAGRLPKGMDESYLRDKFKIFLDRITIEKPYEGVRRDRDLLRDFSAATIGDFVRAVTVTTTDEISTVGMLKERRAEIFMLKQLTWHYVIKAPALTTQQHGQRTIIRELFNLFSKAAIEGDEKNLHVFPLGVREELRTIHKSGRCTVRQEATRAVIDLIAGFTEEQAIDAYYRLTGIALGSALLHRWR